MPDPIFIGIDPGQKGGIATIKKGITVTCPLFDDMVNGWSVLHHWCTVDNPQVYICMEKVTGFIGKPSRINQDGQESNRQPGSRMFNFGRSYGVLEGFLIALEQTYKPRVNWELVTPQKWQKGLGIKRRKGETDTRWKNRLKLHAQYLFPRNFVTLATSDALLLAAYCRKVHTPTTEGK